MNKYIYVGMAPGLLRRTAWGHYIQGRFYVQLDDLDHPWAYGWHVGVEANWRRVYD
jgi:hypothetical protein